VGGNMIIRSKSSFPGVTVGLDPDAVTLIAAMTTAPDAARQQLISDHIVALKDAGIWSLLDIYYILAAHHEQASRLNWKSPGNFTLTANGGITFTTDRGWQGDGSTGYLDTGWIPATHGVNYQLNDASFGVYSRTDVENVGVAMGARRDDLTRLLYFFPRSTADTGNRFIGFINQNGTSAPRSVANSNSLRMHAMRRADSASIGFLKNGSQVGTLSKTSSALVDFPVFISGLNENGSLLAPDTRQYASAFAAAAMSEAQHAALYDAQQNGYLAAVGAAV
jgi:hypothetical protein